MCDSGATVQNETVFGQRRHAEDDITSHGSASDEQIDLYLVFVVDAELQPVDAPEDLQWAAVYGMDWFRRRLHWQ